MSSDLNKVSLKQLLLIILVVPFTVMALWAGAVLMFVG